VNPFDEVARLAKALDQRAVQVREWDAWYVGDHPLPLPPPNTAAATDVEAKRAFENMARVGVLNFLSPVVDAPAAKLTLEGFSGDEGPAREAWEAFRRCEFDADASLVHASALRTGQGFATAWVGEDGRPEFTVEDPEQCIVAYEAGSRRKRRSALKRWVDEDGRQLATLQTPDKVYRFRGPAVSQYLEIVGNGGSGQWKLREDVDPVVGNPLGVVPTVEFRANPSVKMSLFGGGTPEFAKELNDQRRINLTVLNMLVTMEHQAFRQRWVTGWDYPTLEDGTPDKAAMHKASAARLWTFFNDGGGFEPGGEQIKVGEFSQADFRPFLDAIEAWVRGMASRSGTPPYAFLLGNMINVAADPIARIEAVHTAKVRRHALVFGAADVELAKLGLMIAGMSRADVADVSLQPAWAEFEQRTGAEQATLAMAAHNVGMPQRAVFEMFPGVTVEDAARLKREADAQTAFRSVFTAPGVEETEGAQ